MYRWLFLMKKYYYVFFPGTKLIKKLYKTLIYSNVNIVFHIMCITFLCQNSEKNDT